MNITHQSAEVSMQIVKFDADELAAGFRYIVADADGFCAALRTAMQSQGSVDNKNMRR
jgi:hypothetical protein